MIAYQCPYHKKHEDHERCFCQREVLGEKKKIEKKTMNIEQKKIYKNKFAEMRKDLEKKGFFTKGIKLTDEEKKELNWVEDRKCIICGKELPPNLANVCSGSCMKERDKLSTKTEKDEK